MRNFFKLKFHGIPWQSRDWLELWAGGGAGEGWGGSFLVGEPRSCKVPGATKKKRKLKFHMGAF